MYKETIIEGRVIYSPVRKEFYNKLNDNKVNINYNKNPILMDLMISFLKVPVIRSKDHLGSCNGWTLHKNDEIKLKITGGVVHGVEYLDNIQFGVKLSNPYNNFVNPFYIFEIMNTNGRSFFTDYYKSDIEQLIQDQEQKVSSTESALVNAKLLLTQFISEYDLLKHQ